MFIGKTWEFVTNIARFFFVMGFSIKTVCSFHNSLVVNGGNYLELSIFQWRAKARSCELALPTTSDSDIMCVFWWDTWVILLSKHIV